MATKFASSDRELIAILSKDLEFINRTEPKKSLEENTRKIQDRKIISMAKELESDIIAGLNDYFNSYYPRKYNNRPNGLRNNPNGLFEGVEYDPKERTAYIKFSGSAWAWNLVNRDRHESFIPVLLNYGWDRGTSNNDMFNHYEGNNFISDAIEKFNLKCANENKRIQAKFMINGMDAEILYSNGGIPYMR